MFVNKKLIPDDCHIKNKIKMIIEKNVVELKQEIENKNVTTS